MAGRSQVSIRLGTSGRSDVEKDFAALGDAGELQAKRFQTAWERASAATEAALDREAKAAARLAAASPTASGATNMVNPITGGSYAQADGRAQASAAAMTQQFAAGEVAAQRLLASVDPLYAAQLRYDQALAEANTLQQQGAMTTDQLAIVQTGLKKQLDDSTVIYGKQGAAIGNTRIAQMELMHVVRGSVDQFAAGAPPMQIFTMHMGMIGQAAAMSGESLGGLGAFMASGWGLALTVAVVALTPLIGKLLETGTAVDGLVEKEKKEAQQARDSEAAHKVFANSLDGVTEALRRNRNALDKLEEGEKTAARLALETAIAQAEKAKRIRDVTVAMLQQQKAELSSAQSQTFGAAGGAGAGMAVAEYSRQVQDTQDALAEAVKDAATADQQVQEALRLRAVEIFSESAVDKIKHTYDDARTGLIALAGKQATAEEVTNGVLKRRIELLKTERDAKIKAAEEHDRKGPANAGGTAIFDSQISAFFDTAAKYRGLSENRASDRGVLEALFKEANEQVDPEKTAWCAAFVNAVLAANGVKGSGSLAAKSFLGYGKDDTHSPQRGDIVVLKTGGGQHVGFLDSIDKAGNVRVLGGNTGDKVGEATYSKNQVLAVRRPPTPSESDAATAQAASDALRAQGLFDSQSEHLQQEYLQALAKVAVGYEQRADVQLEQAQRDHDAQAQAIATNLAEGKYGEATSKLATDRAAQLTAANDQLLSERQAAIALEKHVKFLQSQDDANERDSRFTLEGLQYQQSIARTSGERKTLGQQIIDIEFKEKELHLQYVLALAQLLGNTKDAADAAAALANLPAEKARANDQNNRQNASPLQAYYDTLPKNMADLKEGMGNSFANGLKSFNDGLTEALMKSKSLKDLWHNFGAVIHGVAQQILKDLIDMAIKMFVIRPLLQAIGGGAGGFGGFATGTEYFGGGTAWVGEHGPELVRLPQGSKIHTAADSRRMAAANDTGIGAIHIPINIDATGADAAGLDRVTAELRQLRQDLPQLAVTAIIDAKQRFIARGSL